MSPRVAVLISGSGTNLQALLDASEDLHPAEIVLVVSDRHKAKGLQRARDKGIATAVLLKRDYDTREDYDRALVDVLHQHRVDWVALAGFMRLVTPVLLDAFSMRVLNIHPALLPAFPGLHAQRQALEHGVRITGATVHFVDDGTDTGPIIVQSAVPVLPSDDLSTLQHRILRTEHRIYPLALGWAVEGRLRVEGRHVTVDGNPATFLWSSD
jgi:phosphoribosylglycinamide formyltransferase 1